MLSSFILGMLSLVALWATFFVLYELILACLYFLVPDKAVTVSDPQKKFAVIIPAHNEEIMIGTALDSWKKVDYPHNLFEVYIIADNCTDRTAEVAHAHGAVCVERHDTEKTGKGHALAWALETLPLNAYDAIVVVDADNTVSPKFLIAMNNRLINGAKVIQGFDGILNPNDSVLTRLIQITNFMKNLLFNHAKSKVGLSVQLMGTGMCFDRIVLQQVGWKAFSIGEDGEQFAYLAEAGIQVEYEPTAIVYAQEASSFGQAYTQRIRWVSGRNQLVGLGLQLLIRGLRRFDWRLVNAALTFLTPHYVELANVTIVGFAITLFWDTPGRSVLLPWFVFLVIGQALYFFIGVGISKQSRRVLSSIGFVPIFLLWRLLINLISIFRLRRSVWVRTERESVRENRFHKITRN